MISRWPNREEIGSIDVFEALHVGLTVDLISTPRDDLMTCCSSETLADVMARNTEPYDFLPVIEPDSAGMDRIVGLFHAAPFFSRFSEETFVEDHFCRLSEDFLIGADASILNVVKTADAQPCRLVVSGDKIVGLVSLSDLQKLPVRAAFFALITGFEMTMAEGIKANFATNADWMMCLSDKRQEKIQAEIASSQKDDGFVDALLFTQFADKATIFRKHFELPWSKTSLGKKFSEIRKLRDNLAHANEYAATPEHARNVCATVRDLLDIKAEIASLFAPNPAPDRTTTTLGA